MKDDQPTRPSQDLLLDAFRQSWEPLFSESSSQDAPSIDSFARVHGIESDSELMKALVDLDIHEHQKRGWDVVASRYPTPFSQLVDGTKAIGRSDNTGLGDAARVDAGLEQASVSTNLDDGQRVQDFEVAQLIGIGSYGRVYLARDVTLDRMVALKVTVATAGTSRYSEGRVLARLSHPHIVSVFREEEIAGLRLLAMQFVAGHSLKEWNDHMRCRASRNSVDDSKMPCFFDWAQSLEDLPSIDGRTSEVQAAGIGHVDATKPSQEVDSKTRFSNSTTQVMVDLVRKIADALQHAHGRGVLHHDIKPANILIDAGGNPLLTDFNVASVLGDSSRSAIGGTLSYMSPEHLQALSPETDGSIDNVDVRSDLYSLGVVLFELLTGKKHWSKLVGGSAAGSEGIHQLLADRLAGAPLVDDNWFDSTHCSINSALWAIIRKSLAPNPALRYQTANQFATDLACWSKGLPNVHANRGSRKHRLALWFQRNRRSVAVTAAGAAMLTGLVAFTVRSERSQLIGCGELADAARTELVNGNSPGASERLGRAKQGLAQVRLTRLLMPNHFSKASEKVASVSREVGHYELQRFTAQFGEVSLLQTHNAEASEVGARNPKDLIENALRSYGVLQRDDWQERSPFTDLSEREQILVEENVTQLMLHCLLDAGSESREDQQQAARMLKRLPKRHRTLSLVKQMSNGSGPTQPPRIELVRDGFEAYLYGVIESQAEQDNEAYRWLSRSIGLRPADSPPRFWTHYLLGFTCQRMGNYDEALVQYGICVGMRPGFAWPVFNMGLASVRRGNFELAKRCLRSAIEKDSEFSAAYTALGALEHRLGNLTGALAVYEEAIESYAISSDLLFNRANTLMKIGDRQAAISCLESCLARGPHSTARELLRRLRGNRSDQ